MSKIIPCETLLRWNYKSQCKEKYKEKVDNYSEAAEYYLLAHITYRQSM